MPVSFPSKPRGFPIYWAKNLIQKPFDYVPAPNMGNPNFRFIADTLGSGRGKIFPRVNQQNPGINFAITFAAYNIEKRPQHLIDGALWKELKGTLNMTLSGVSRDSAGVALPACTVLVFRTQDNSLVATTISDANGAWSVSLLKGGPFFIVEYLAGTPDLAGTSLNTLTPIQV